MSEIFFKKMSASSLQDIFENCGTKWERGQFSWFGCTVVTSVLVKGHISCKALNVDKKMFSSHRIPADLFGHARASNVTRDLWKEAAERSGERVPKTPTFHKLKQSATKFSETTLEKQRAELLLVSMRLRGDAGRLKHVRRSAEERVMCNHVWAKRKAFPGVFTHRRRRAEVPEFLGWEPRQETHSLLRSEDSRLVLRNRIPRLVSREQFSGTERSCHACTSQNWTSGGADEEVPFSPAVPMETLGVRKHLQGTRERRSHEPALISTTPDLLSLCPRLCKAKPLAPNRQEISRETHEPTMWRKAKLLSNVYSAFSPPTRSNLEI